MIGEIKMEIKVSGEAIPEEEINEYVKYVNNKVGSVNDIDTLFITVDGDFVDLQWTYNQIPFDRIRRITGYLVGSLDRFNNGKKAEEKDRVKHSV